MSKEVMIGMLKVANNGNDLLQILDALTDTNEEVISFMEGLKWDTPSGEAVMALGNGHQAIQDQAIGKSQWNSDKKRVELVDIEYFKAKCVNPPEGIKSLDWIKGGFQGAEC